jgi:hypothetical protein
MPADGMSGCRQPHHRMRPCIWCPLELLGTCLLDRADLLTDQCQPHIVEGAFIFVDNA